MEPLSILIAEDDMISRRILQRAVEQAGHRCVVTGDGSEAWDAFQTADYDVLISDWMMPGMDGLELCRRVRHDGSRPYTYVILLTALDDKSHFLEGMQAGADDYLGKPFDTQELQARLIAAERVMRLHHDLAQQNVELALLNAALAESARTDPLTGLGNRLRLWEDLKIALSQTDRYGFFFAVAMCDVDHFKAYNDTYGHPAGDKALRAIAQTMATQCRTGDRAYRYGGEEFILLLPAQTADRAAIALNRIREAVRAIAIDHAGNKPELVLTISGGVAVSSQGAGQTAETLISQADAALYEAKSSGRNQIVTYRPEFPGLTAAQPPAADQTPSEA